MVFVQLSYAITISNTYNRCYQITLKFWVNCIRNKGKSYLLKICNKTLQWIDAMNLSLYCNKISPRKFLLWFKAMQFRLQLVSQIVCCLWFTCVLCTWKSLWFDIYVCKFLSVSIYEIMMGARECKIELNRTRIWGLKDSFVD